MYYFTYHYISVAVAYARVKPDANSRYGAIFETEAI